MTATTPTAAPSPAPHDPAAVALERAVATSWKAPVAFGIFTVISLVLFVLFRREGSSTFGLSTGTDLIQLAPVVLPTAATGIVVTVLLAALTVVSALLVRRSAKVPLWFTAVFAILFLVAFLTWASAGQTIPVPGLLVGTVALSVPLIFGALGGVLSERVGVVNVAIEGQLLAGAFVSAVVASITGQPLIGLASAMVAGMLVSFVLAAFAIKYLVDQVIVGVVLNVLVTGLTSFLFSQVLSADPGTLNSPPRFDRIDIPVLGQIPIIGPVLFRQTIIVYLMYVAVFLVWYCLFHTRWGLRLRAVGEHPQAADTVGIKVSATRFWNVSLAGAIAGLGGAFFTLGSVGAFNKEMTAGAGFIALAAVIFGRWDPLRATLAALLFGFASNLQNVLGVIGSPVPSEFMLMLPYVVTIAAVAGLVGQVRGPAAAGKPYVKS
ncbi:ABC transporter permease [Clavibacter sp. VKM Ac-2872]|uniref:ABC transporter permease n=1 Tax=Clavibacter sp. VKM Ac-2872 TaxID=2783812 RepID=UPI00188C1AE8|nr:ABC transporter permease [Clavibacter sp. VKM Ac-2872]MBF4623564.1 ABC transporter permease [Clavibacter sp. VKM Ac-2872]